MNFRLDHIVIAVGDLARATEDYGALGFTVQPGGRLDPEELAFYFDFFRYGVPPHGGFGMGLTRVLMLLLGLPNIREASYLYRGPTRLLP